MGKKHEGGGRVEVSGQGAALSTSLADKLRAHRPVTRAESVAEPRSIGTPEDRGLLADPKKGVLSPCEKVVLRMERKGHGGKIVTVVAGLLGSAARDRESLAKRLGKALGCGARLEGNEIVLQGDHRERALPLLEREGARRVVRSG